MRLYRCWDYQAGTWASPHRIICKAEVTPQGHNIRFVVTNLKGRTTVIHLQNRLLCTRQDGKLHQEPQDLSLF